MPEVLDGLPRRVGGWAVNRSLAPVSLTGISLALGLCAAAWFSAGSRPDNVSGALALLASYLAGRAARWLAGPGATAGARTGPAAARAGTLAELGGALSDCVVYAGLAVGGYQAHWGGTWAMAVSVVIAMAVRRAAAACGGHIAAARDGNLGRTIREFLAFSPGGRVAVTVVAAPVWGAHATLLALLEWGIIATAYAITGHGPRREAAAGAARAVGPARRPVVVSSPAGVAPPARAALPALQASAAGAHHDGPPAVVGPPPSATTLELMIHHEPDPRREPEPPMVLDPRARAAIAACRDDGAAAVWLSRIVRGQFVPLPPAVAGLAATSFLAWLGMRDLPGVLLLTPLVVMLLAAFGAGHPHAGRLDWLVPAVLVAGQLVYVAAIGFSFGVPAPLTFTLCSLIALRYVSLAGDDRESAAAGTRLGWEGRMLAAGVGAMLGVSAIVYAALVVYVAVLICGRVRAGLLPARVAIRAGRPPVI
jgi:hypothetical protein